MSQTFHPIQWLGRAEMHKVRELTPDWLWTDYPAWAHHRFGTDVLTELQLQEVFSDFLTGAARRMGTDQGKKPELIEMRPNRGGTRAYRAGMMRFYQNGNTVGIGFPTPQAALEWGQRLVRRNQLPWFRALAEVQERLKLHAYETKWRGNRAAFGFGPNDTIVEDPQLVKVLNRRSKLWGSETLPYPDSTPIERTYISMDVGVRLKDPDGTVFEVARAAHRIDDYPVLTLVEKETP